MSFQFFFNKIRDTQYYSIRVNMNLRTKNQQFRIYDVLRQKRNIFAKI